LTERVLEQPLYKEGDIYLLCKCWKCGKFWYALKRMPYDLPYNTYLCPPCHEGHAFKSDVTSWFYVEGEKVVCVHTGEEFTVKKVK